MRGISKGHKFQWRSSIIRHYLYYLLRGKTPKNRKDLKIAGRIKAEGRGVSAQWHKKGNTL